MIRNWKALAPLLWRGLFGWLIVARRKRMIERRQLSCEYRRFETFPHWRDVMSIVEKNLRDQGIPINPNIGDEVVICGHLLPYEYAAAVQDYLEWMGWVEVRQFGGVGGYGSYLRFDPLPNDEHIHH